MALFEHILFPVDFSDRCLATKPYVLAMAQRFKSKLTLLHVVQIPVSWYGGMEVSYPIPLEIAPLREDARKKLDVFNDFPGDINVTMVVEDGDPAMMIASFAEQNGVDLVMLPTHGYGKFRALLLGSVAAKVLHDASCPVWTSAHAEEPAVQKHVDYRSILCAVDLSPGSADLIKRAVEFTGHYNAKLRLVHAIGATEARPDKYLDTEFRQFLVQSSRDIIKDMQRELGVNLEVCIDGAAVSTAVHDAAVTHQADLVIIGRGRVQKPLGRLRTNSYAIIRDCPCPVLSI
jgi:nucleotide-binding universal stress UspA family protein